MATTIYGIFYALIILGYSMCTYIPYVRTYQSARIICPIINKGQDQPVFALFTLHSLLLALFLERTLLVTDSASNIRIYSVLRTSTKQAV